MLITTIGVSRRSSALRSTNRVCGSGPSDASTSSITPSTIDSVRSTSPPKSAWPGRVDDVDEMSLIVDGGVLGEDGDAALALEFVAVHRALGDARSLARNVPLWCSSASTSVVLPWSTWAMMATLRRRGLAITIQTVLPTRTQDAKARQISYSLEPCSALCVLSAISTAGRARDRRTARRRRFAQLLPSVAGTRQVVERDRGVLNHDVRDPAAARSTMLCSRFAIFRSLRAGGSSPARISAISVFIRSSASCRQRAALGMISEARGHWLSSAQHETEVVARFTVVLLALERFVELRARHLELVAAVGDDAGELRHLSVDQELSPPARCRSTRRRSVRAASR